MSGASFQSFVERFCKAHALVLEPVLRGEPIEVDGVAFSLFSDEEAMPGQFLLYTDFGPVPPRQEAQVYRLLLQANLVSHAGSGSAFALSESAERVVFADRLRLDALTPSLFAEILLARAGTVHAWRADPWLLQGEKRSDSPCALLRELRA